MYIIFMHICSIMYDLLCLYPVFQAFWCQEPFLGTYVGESWTAQSWQPFLYAHWAWHHRLQNKVCLDWILKYCSFHLCPYNFTFCSLPLPIIILFINIITVIVLMIYVHVVLRHQHCNYAWAIFFIWSFSTLFLFCISTIRAFLDIVAYPF